MPKVSVIIPTYNRSAYLSAGIKSILEQAFTDFEIVISDNNSTDDTEQVVKSFTDSRIVYHKNQVNIGMTHNYNKALELATGSYIQVFSDDDIMLADCLEENVKVLDSHPEVGLVHTDINIIDGSGNLKSANHWGGIVWQKWPEIHNKSKFFPKEVYQNYLYNIHNIIGMPTVMMRKAVVEKLGYFDDKLSFILDWDYWLRASMYFNFYFINKKLVSYREHDGSMTTENRQLMINELKYIKAKIKNSFADQLVVKHSTIAQWGQEIYFFSDYDYKRLLKHLIRKVMPKLSSK